MLIFFGGAACGAAAATFHFHESIRHAMDHPGSVSFHIASQLKDMLGLTDEQADQIHEIILRRHNALIDIRREIQPRLESELTILENEIAEVLDEAQRVKWHAHAAAIRSQWLPPIPEPASAP